MKFACPACQGRIEATAEHFGLEVHCPHCGSLITVPSEKPDQSMPSSREIRAVDLALQLLVAPASSSETGPTGSGDFAAAKGRQLEAMTDLAPADGSNNENGAPEQNATHPLLAECLGSGAGSVRDRVALPANHDRYDWRADGKQLLQVLASQVRTGMMRWCGRVTAACEGWTPLPKRSVAISVVATLAVGCAVVIFVWRSNSVPRVSAVSPPQEDGQMACLSDDLPRPNGGSDQAASTRIPWSGWTLFCSGPENGASTKAEDLQTVMSAAGFDSVQWEWDLASFVRFGSSEVAKKFTSGDQFDRAEIKTAVKNQSDALRKRRFVVKKLTFSMENRDDFETQGVFALLKLPLRVRGQKPLAEDYSAYRGMLHRLHPAEWTTLTLAFLTKNNTLRTCTPEEAYYVKQNNGVLYLSEASNTNLLMNFRGDLEQLKDLARNVSQYTAEIEITDLAWEKPPTWGYFRRDAVVEAEQDCEQLREDRYLDPMNPQPPYFITAIMDGGRERRNDPEIPEGVQGKMLALRVLTKDGKVIGRYAPKEND